MAKRKYSTEFRRQAVELMKDCNSVAGLARQLGIRRKFLYQWKQELAGEAAPATPVVATKKEISDRLTELEKELAQAESVNRELKALTAEQELKLRFFQRALQRIETAPGSRDGAGKMPSSPRSAK